MRYITFENLDEDTNLLFLDNGDTFPVVDYLDEDENPCLFEEARYVDVEIENSTFRRYEIDAIN